MVLYSREEDCCGCSACKYICPKEAIMLLPDDEGFLYPVIDRDNCINCGACIKVCAFKNGYDTTNNFQEPLAYMVRHKNMHEVEESRSGAMFTALSDYILENGGVIYGVGYVENFRVVHKRATNQLERSEFKGSKYVESDINNTFQLLKNDLDHGQYVLFCGTPCQAAGLNQFLKNVKTDRLFVCDIVCHGVPSPNIWRDYLIYIENKYKDKIVEVNFRDKQFGWASHVETFKLSKNRTKINRQTFANLFLKNIMLRPSCGNCKYANVNRPSDITLADYWGWENVEPTFNIDDKGVSLVLVNTQKGESLFNKISKNIFFIKSSVDKSLQPNLLNPTVISPLRKRFWSEYKKFGFRYVGRKYSDIDQNSLLLKLKINNVKKLWKMFLKKQ